MWINALNNSTESLNQVDNLTETAKNLTPEEKTDISKKIKLPEIKKDNINKEQSNQQMAKAESLSTEKVAKIHNFVDKYANHESFGNAIKEYTIVWMADANEFVTWWPEQKKLEEQLVSISQSLIQKWFDRSTILNKQNIQIWEWFLENQIKNLTNPKEKSDKLNKRLSIARALELLNSFSAEQIRTIAPKLKIKTKIADEKGWEYRKSSFDTKIDNIFMPNSNPPAGNIVFNFSQIWRRITGTQWWTKIYNDKDVWADEFKLWAIKTHIQYKHSKRNRENPNLIDTRKKEINKWERNWSWSKNQEAEKSQWWKFGDTFKNEITNKFDNTNSWKFIIENQKSYNSQFTDAWPKYSINILADKIDENGKDSWITEYFDIQRNTDGLVTSIQMKDTLRSGNAYDDYKAAIAILKRLNIEEPTSWVSEHINKYNKSLLKKQENDSFYNHLAELSK